MDTITHLFSYFNFRTDLFFIGNLCHIGTFEEPDPNKGYLHFIRQGHCQFSQPNKAPIVIDRPCVVFSPSHIVHHIHPLDAQGLDIFCIKFDFGEDVRNPLTHSLQDIAVVYLDTQPELRNIANLIFSETEKQGCGYQAAIQHLCAYFAIQVVRCCLEQKRINVGLLKGLTDKYLARLLLDIHQYPERNWQVDIMAEYAMMSRSRFAGYFKEMMGISPMDYLTQWRITVAQMLLQKGLAVSLVAEKVGYSHSAALSRAFTREIGLSPTEWLNKQKG